MVAALARQRAADLRAALRLTCLTLGGMTIDAHGRTDEAATEAVKRRAARWAGYTLYVQAAYVVTNPLLGLFILPTRESAWVILVGTTANFGRSLPAVWTLKVTAPTLIPFLIKEGREAISGGCSCIGHRNCGGASDAAP